MPPTLPSLSEIAREPRSPAEVGGKAVRLAQLVRAGLPVPDGVVVPAGALTGERGGIDAAICSAAEALGPVVIVRSSSTAEDRTDGAAPGLFLSRPDVQPHAAASAVAEVVASGRRPVVEAYLQRRGVVGPPPAIAVVIQRQVGGGAPVMRGVLYTRPPGRPDAEEVLIEGAGEPPRAATARREDGVVVNAETDLGLSAAQVAELVRLALAAERAIDAPRGADVEWVLHDGALWLVQARPIVHPQRRFSDPQLAVEIAFSRVRPGRVWRWDAAHNPDPLSPAQAGLVALVSDVAPDELRVVGSYLYSAPRDEPRARDSGELDAAGLEGLYRGEVLWEAERALAPVEGVEPPALEDALAAYRVVVHLHGCVLGPALARARRASGRRAVAGSAVARALDAGPEALASLAPAWDVAAPTFAESSELVTRARTRWSQRGPAAAPAPHDATDLAAVAAAIAEADDFLFFRAQQVVRRALLALAARWNLHAPDDIFYLPFHQVRTAVRRGAPIDPDAARGAAAAARLDRATARERVMPLAFRDGRPLVAATAATTAALASGAWRGTPAAPGTARGAAAHLRDLGAFDDDLDGRVVVARSITPATLVQIVGAAALVCEQGGALDHAAAMARELGLPCVVGCGSSVRRIAVGDELLVDGDGGLVVRLGGPG